MSDFWKGIALDWGPSISSVIEPKIDKDILRSSVLWIVLTALGERCMQPEFGTILPTSVFEPNDVITANKIKASVRSAIEKWDDRIEFVDFTVKSVENKMYCTLTWKQTADPVHDSYQVTEIELTDEAMSRST